MPLRLGQKVQALLRGNLTPRQRRLPSALTNTPVCGLCILDLVHSPDFLGDEFGWDSVLFQDER